MIVKIKKFNVDMEVKTSGVELDVSDTNGHKGDLFITKTELIWCRGKTSRQGGNRLKWEDFIAYMESRR